MPPWTVKLQFGKETVNILAEPETKLKVFQASVENVTGVFVRNQKIIFKGKVLEGEGSTLADLKLRDGAKVMLMSSSGRLQTGGQLAAQQLAAQRSKDAKARLAAGLPSSNQPSRSSTSASTAATLEARAAGWAKTGVVSLTGEKVTSIPEVVWNTATAVRVVDLSDNDLSTVSDRLRL
eukprot:CAMPEP_0117687452 /NCGR_PEP_ID=MMETSP0804-20121206/23148_1 /TAXON_ID=1074897 /ORGANISM="Tetraselmis astigmatica, Strain CCMP880" /LENGTH=178 /DNA_ID=CAMNT_0005499527 /DNA_START=57 /DNA_END=589 /DNA_ORIENTATION=-